MNVAVAVATILGVFAAVPVVAYGSVVNHSVVANHSATVSSHATPEVAALEYPERLRVEAPASPTIQNEGPSIVRYESSRRDIALYVPKSLSLRDGHFDLVIHFHGSHTQTMAALDDAELGAVIVNVNLGEGGKRYGAAASAANILDRLVGFAEREVSASGRAKGARVGRIALSSWSAGFGAVREILKRPLDASRVDAVLLADGLFTDWTSSKQRDADFEKVKSVIDFARLATEGEKLFVLTHTSIDRAAYPGAPRCADAMLRHFNIERGFPGGSSSADSQPYATDHAGFHIWGFGGKAWSDHLAQHRAMGGRQYSALRAYWR